MYAAPDEGKSKAPFGIGAFIDAVKFIITSLLATLVIFLGMLILSFFIGIKVGIRAISLALLMIVSPPFFACASSETTREYFKKWFNTFFGTVLELVFMAIVFKVGSGWLVKNSDALVFSNGGIGDPNALTWVIIFVAMCCLMIKPPAILRNLVS